MRKLMMTGILLATHGTLASVCDIVTQNNRYAVYRDGQQFTEWSPTGDLSIPVQNRIELVAAQVCTMPDKIETCDVVNKDHFYAIYRGGQQFTAWTAKGHLASVIKDMDTLVRGQVCLGRKTDSVCDIASHNNFYSVLRDGQQFTEWSAKGDLSIAIQNRVGLISTQVCTLPSKLETCDIVNNNYSYAIFRNGQQFTGWTLRGDISPAVKSLNILIKGKVCLNKEVASICDIANNNYHYSISRDGQQFTELTAKGDISSAIKVLNNLVSSGVCVKGTVTPAHLLQ